ncbi:MAG: ABC transporter substrate-binding protein [Anaerolineaceae bacterium]|nr:ABC transporter substrate-binding protein [Anaerolineaceae bacterium]
MRKFALLIAVLGVLLTGALLSTLAADVSVTMVLSRDPISMDPQGPIDPSAPVILAYVYDTLLFQDNEGAILPYLATSWDVEQDGRLITFHLRDDVQFSNGDPLNADSVIFTFQRLQEIGQRSFIYSEIINIAEFEKVDDYTVRFHLRAPSVTLLSALTYTYAGILDPSAVEAAGDEYGQNPVGSGPYMVTEWIPQNSMTLVANPNYHGQRPTDQDGQASAVTELDIRFSSDESARVNALLTGEVDVAYISSGALMQSFADNPDFTILDSPTRGLVFLGFNTAREPFSDVTMRQAVAEAIDKQVILDIAAPGMGVIVNELIAPSIFGYVPELESEALPYDVDTARAAVEAAGYVGAEIKILTSNFPTYQNMATIVQAELQEIGLNPTIEVLDFAGVAATANAGEYDIVLTRYDWNDPDLLRIYLSTDSIGRANRYFYSNPELDALTAEGRATFDPAERLAIYTEAQRLLMQDVPWVPLHMTITKIVVNNRLQNVGVVNSHVTFDDATTQ